MKKITISFLFSILLLGGVCAQETLTIATFNIRMDTPNDGKNAWPNRKEMMKALVQFHDFDIFGTQEGFVHQLRGILEIAAYDYVGSGRDDGKEAGEHSAIVYKKDRFSVLDKGDFWLSETPDVPGKGWDATCCNRICSWAKFKDQKNGKEFYFFNVHYDHEGEEARRESSKLMLSKIKNIAGNLPFFCTGDFNATPESEPIQLIDKEGTLIDAYKITKQPPYGPVGTFQGFKIETRPEGRIDYIFVSKGIQVNKYGVLTDMDDNRFPSDHFPVMVHVEW